MSAIVAIARVELQGWTSPRSLGAPWPGSYLVVAAGSPTLPSPPQCEACMVSTTAVRRPSIGFFAPGKDAYFMEADGMAGRIPEGNTA